MTAFNLKIFSAITAATMLLAPAADAMAQSNRDRGNRRSGTTQTSRQPNRGKTDKQTPRLPGNKKQHGSSARPASGNTRPTSTPRPGHGSSTSGTKRPGNGHQRPNKPDRPNRPDNGRPGNSNNRPGKPNRPGHGLRPGQHRPPGHSAPRPGAGSRPRPVYGYYRHERPLPPRPPRPHHVYIGPRVPSMGTILGLAIGSLIDYGLNSLINGGYNIAGYTDNAIYLSNVSQFGYSWPEVTVYYNNGVMNGSRYQYGATTPGLARYNSIYSQLCSQYGAPQSQQIWKNTRTATWWCGGDTGYITLSYGPGDGRYYTDIIYGQ